MGAVTAIQFERGENVFFLDFFEICFIVVPMLLTIWLSFQSWSTQTGFDTARFIGLRDRGVIAVGQRADLNVIDHARLSLDHPRIQRDLPAGGRRLMQNATGYIATLVRGEVIAREGKLTGARPGGWPASPADARSTRGQRASDTGSPIRRASSARSEKAA